FGLANRSRAEPVVQVLGASVTGEIPLGLNQGLPSTTRLRVGFRLGLPDLAIGLGSLLLQKLTDAKLSIRNHGRNVFIRVAEISPPVLQIPKGDDAVTSRFDSARCGQFFSAGLEFHPPVIQVEDDAVRLNTKVCKELLNVLT